MLLKQPKLAHLGNLDQGKPKPWQAMFALQRTGFANAGMQSGDLRPSSSEMGLVLLGEAHYQLHSLLPG